jgi:restriction system protein
MTRFVIALLVLSGVAVVFGSGAVLLAGSAGIAVALSAVSFSVARFLSSRRAKRRLDGLRALSPGDFEAEVARWLRRAGWDVEHLGGTGDGGIDLLATRKRETLAVQCKRYAEHAAVSAAQVRDLYGAAVALGATGALLVTTGRVSAAARAWAEGLPDGPVLAFQDMERVAALASGHGRIT